MPQTGDVDLPTGSKVLVSQSISGQLGTILVPSDSELIFGESPDGINVDVSGIRVEGVMRAGSETCRLETPLTITLHGSRPVDIVTQGRENWYKGIAVTGSLELHGKRYYRTWSRLARSVDAGDDLLLLQHPVNWEPDQEIVVVTTAMKDSREWHENEVHVVDRVENMDGEVGAVVYLRSPISHAHIANSGYQAEVALLTRVIKIQGAADDSEPTDPDPMTCSDRWLFGDTGAPCPNTELTGFGGHIIVYSGGTGYVEGVELYRMGQ